ncbi:class I SAM-dependent methyltransferase [Nocardioides sp. AX2bis]|uniref:class I SAM-dependent methyltransferase n=1 Tax=Nocardioides sp. AX2bis TaxID=2653157 RepID=UPI00135C5A49|nr:class I SAM-dependent methyltransferase [Nocardioides sp. AX2bis]
MFSQKAVRGWVSVPADAPPTRVTLHLDDLEVTATYATTDPDDPDDPTPEGDAPASTADEASGGGRRRARGPGRHLLGPGHVLRNSGEEVRWFRFRLADLWRFCDPNTEVSVQIGGSRLPITGHGLHLSPPSAGRRSVDDVRRRLAEGSVFSQKGRLQASKQLDLEWQRKVLDLYTRTRTILREKHGHDVFFTYGTLLGAVREGTYIGHDVDFDAAFVTSATDPDGAAGELVDVSLTLIGEGLSVTALPPHLHISDPADPDLHIDLFHTYFDEAGELCFPFGVAGTSTIHRRDWQGVREIDWPAGRGLVPVNAEQVVECLYGPDWRQPKPGFHWPRERTRLSAEAKLTKAHQSKVYWADFYARNRYTSGSTFAAFMDARSDTPGTVVDIGCGDGRDACAFGSAGRHVVGLDQSPVGVEHASGRAATLGLTDRVRFEVCDVSETEHLGEVLGRAVAGAGDDPVMFYLRFFLHSIPRNVQAGLVRTISAVARPGDVLAAEFRTEGDKAVTKVHGQHYRRFQDGPAFGRRLSERHGFALLHEEEGTGLSPYQGEDPVLYRVVARRT